MAQAQDADHGPLARLYVILYNPGAPSCGKEQCHTCSSCLGSAMTLTSCPATHRSVSGQGTETSWPELIFNTLLYASTGPTCLKRSGVVVITLLHQLYQTHTADEVCADSFSLLYEPRTMHTKTDGGADVIRVLQSVQGRAPCVK